MKNFKIQNIIDIAKQAGDAIMAIRPNITVETKGDDSPVTQADKAASDIIMTGLAEITPNIPVISEEAPAQDNDRIIQNHDTYWITDPLDGTKSFIEGYDGFGVHIGLISDGVPVAGVVYFPEQGKIYFTGDDNKAYLTDEKTNETKRIQTNDHLTPPFTAAVSWKKKAQPESINDHAYDPVPAVGGGRLCVAAEGLADLAVVDRPFSYWDVAAAHAVLLAAGGDMVNAKTGEPTRYHDPRLYIDPALAGGKTAIAKAMTKGTDMPAKPKAPKL